MAKQNKAYKFRLYPTDEQAWGRRVGEGVLFAGDSASPNDNTHPYEFIRPVPIV